MATEVVMPQMGESIAEGTITKWLKNVGDHIERDEPLFEISTDKVDAEIPSPSAGVLSKVLFNEGDTVEVNTVVAILNGGDGAAAPVSEAVATPTAPAPNPPSVTATEPAVTPTNPPSAASTQPKAYSWMDSNVASSESPRPASTEAARETTQAGTEPAVADREESQKPLGEMSAEELRKTRSSPLVRNIAKEHGIDLLGTNAGLSLYPARLFRNGPEGYEEVNLHQTKLPYSEDRIHHFVHSILDGKRTIVPPEESLKIIQVLEAIYTSSSNGKEVRLGK